MTIDESRMYIYVELSFVYIYIFPARESRLDNSDAIAKIKRKYIRNRTHALYFPFAANAERTGNT